jgi:tRNA G18 (ribose-2'-O)-methylase SpoU
VLVLCGIANHDNIGGIYRNAAAFGADAVVLDADCCDPLYRKAIRVSVGAALSVPTAHLARGEDIAELLASDRFRGAGAEPLGDRESWLRLRPAPRTAVLLGAEGPGLSAGGDGAGADDRHPDGGRFRLAERRHDQRHRACITCGSRRARKPVS